MRATATEEPLYNSRILNTYLEFAERNYPQVNVREILEYAGVESYQVKDEGHWFTQTQHDRFHEKLVLLTGNPSIAREAGRFAAASNGTGLFRQYALAWMGPVAAFNMLGRLSSKFTRSSVYRSRRLSSNSLEVIVTPRPGTQEKPYQCENRWGMFQAIFDFFHYRLSRTEHPECVFRGGKCCRYVFAWETPASVFWKRIRNALAAVFLAVGALLVPYFPLDTLILLSALSVLFLMNLLINFFEKKELTDTIARFRRSAEEQIDQKDVNYKNAVLINEIGQAINKSLHLEDIFREIMDSLKLRLDFDRGMILLADPTKKYLVFSSGYGLEKEQMALVRRTVFHLDEPDSKGTFLISFRDRKPVLVDDSEKIQGQVSEKSREFLLAMGSRSFICCPIVYEKDALGVLVVDNIRKKRELTQTDVSLLMGIANQIGISINNARIMEQQKRQFTSILRVLAASIDARDPLTAGHSEKVTEYALGIAREMGLDQSFCEVLSIAALLHDYGKIGIRDNILKKPGRLTEEEYEEIRSHALKSKLILVQMNFSEEYADIPLWAGAHHEKFDGSGYPDGLKGEAIPLGARIIAVADVFEALTAQRHYRDPMPVEKALEIVRAGSGSAFDPQVVAAFERYFQQTFARKKGALGIYETVSPRPLIEDRPSTLH